VAQRTFCSWTFTVSIFFGFLLLICFVFSFFALIYFVWSRATDLPLAFKRIHYVFSESNIALQEFLRSHNPNQQHSATLESFLIKPIQRILKYPLLLRQLTELTDPSSNEHVHLRGPSYTLRLVCTITLRTALINVFNIVGKVELFSLTLRSGGISAVLERIYLRYQQKLLFFCIRFMIITVKKYFLNLKWQLTNQILVTHLFRVISKV